jgi:hypothetical protein
LISAEALVDRFLGQDAELFGLGRVGIAERAVPELPLGVVGQRDAGLGESSRNGLPPSGLLSPRPISSGWVTEVLLRRDVWP